MKRLVRFVVSGLLLFGVSLPVTGQEDHFNQIFGLPPFVFKLYQFPTEDTLHTRVDIRIGLVNDVLQFTRLGEDRYRAGYEIAIDILDKEDNHVAGDIVTRRLYVTQFSETNARSFLNQERFQFLLAPGDYKIYLDIMDMETRKHLKREREFRVERYFIDKLKLSSIVFLQKDRRRGNKITYNLTHTYTHESQEPAIRFWVAGLSAGDSFRDRFKIQDWAERTLETRQAAFLATGHLQEIEWPLEDRFLQPGRFVLGIEAEQGPNRAEAHERFSIHFWNRTARPNGVPLGQKILEEFGPLQYILPEKLYTQIVQSDSLVRAQLIEAFWQKRDPTPGTPRNELREEFDRRVAFVNKHFSVLTLKKYGWQTDRGRIYLLYGPPTLVQRPTDEFGDVPVEVWYYKTIDKRFVFKDKKENGDFKLIYEE